MYKRKQYPANWFDTIRPAVLKREDYKCKHCKLPHRSEGYHDYNGKFVKVDAHEKSWAIRNGLKVHIVYLHIAHLDQNRDNNNLDNLRALCPQCHRNFDKEIQRFTRRQI